MPKKINSRKEADVGSKNNSPSGGAIPQRLSIKIIKNQIVMYTIKCNESAKTYTIRQIIDGKIVGKYRSYPQGKDFSVNWTQNDIISFLRHSNDYYVVRKKYSWLQPHDH
jgi:hypothetical protein